jgi:pyridoxal phosphate enzyme (YggS family)
MPGGAVVSPSTTLPERIRSAQARIATATRRSGRPAGAVTLVAVTKTLPAAVVTEAYRSGLAVFGENRVQEGVAKRAVVDLSASRWELIGHLQTNKVAAALSSFDRIQSVDSLRLARAISERAALGERGFPILLEVNVAGEVSKSGFSPDEVLAAAPQILTLPHLQVEGLMTVAPIAERAEDVRPIFARLRELRDQLRSASPSALDGGWAELSMGMSDDFEVAIEEGATLVRLGRVLFGQRPAAVAQYDTLSPEEGP